MADIQNSVPVSWEEFLKRSSITKEGHDEWRVRFEDSVFAVRYENFLMYPLSLSGASVFRLEKCKPENAADRWSPFWKIHVRAELRSYHDEEIIRVVWCHLARTEGDYCKLYEYDRLDKTRPEGAIGEPEEIGGIKRWKISCCAGLGIVESYIYVAPDGRRADVILVETTRGYKWEISTDCSRYGSHRAAERKIIRALRGS